MSSPFTMHDEDWWTCWWLVWLNGWYTCVCRLFLSTSSCSAWDSKTKPRIHDMYKMHQINTSKAVCKLSEPNSTNTSGHTSQRSKVSTNTAHPCLQNQKKRSLLPVALGDKAVSWLITMLPKLFTFSYTTELLHLEKKSVSCTTVRMSVKDIVTT